MEIPDYPITFTSTSIDSKENSGVTAQLKAEDKNPNENPVSIDKATSLTGKAWLTLKQTQAGYDLKVETPYTYSGPYQVELELKNPTGKLEKKILQGNITKETGIDYSKQPNDTTFNWYGPGRIVNPFDHQPISQSDVAILTEVANGTFSDPSDTRLRDRCDVNGDGYVNMQDVEILRERVNGTRESLDGEWNLQPTRAKKEDWASKMFVIDKTNLNPFPDGDCNQYRDQTYINMHGVATKDIPKFLQVYPYDFADNGRFNMPLLEVTTDEKDAQGLPNGHAMNAFIFGNPSTTFDNIYPVEPQFDNLNDKFGEHYVIGIDCKYYIKGPPLKVSSNKSLDMKGYVNYYIKNKISTFTWMEPTLIHPSGK